MDGVIRDNKKLNRYELEFDGIVTFVTYMRAPGVITLIHTEVPKELSGHGIGTKLVREVLDIARADGVKVNPRCSFILAYMRKHDDVQDLLSDPTDLE